MNEVIPQIKDDLDNTYEEIQTIEEDFRVFKESLIKVFDSFKNEKLSTLEQIIEGKTLVLPVELKDYWEEETDYTVVSYKEFKKDINSSKEYIFVSLFGYGWNIHPKELLDSINRKSCKVHFIFYQNEQEVYEILTQKNHQELMCEYRSEDRKKISGIEFIEKEEDKNQVDIKQKEKLKDLINRLIFDERKSGVYPAIVSNSSKYQLSFESEVKVFELDGSKVVLLIEGEKKRKISVSNIQLGDEVIIYDNQCEEILDNIVKNNSKFREIENAAHKWITKLKEYKELNNLSEKRLFASLKDKGISIKRVQSLKGWLKER